MVTTHTTAPTAHAEALATELDWLETVVLERVATHQRRQIFDLEDFIPPNLDESSNYGHLVIHYHLTAAERLALALALAPHVRPAALDAFFALNESLNRGYAEFGGVRGKAHGGFLPTGETVLFLLAAGDVRQRLPYYSLFDRDHVFAAHRLVQLDTVPRGEPRWAGTWAVTDTLLDWLTLGSNRKPDFSADFPARLLESALDWDDLVLTPQTGQHLEELLAWVHYERVLHDEWGLGRHLKAGYRTLFYGPPGTGKTLTATLLGKKVGRDVYRVDLSTVVSKYIGETEKNLEKIFERLETQQAILFFDEADALFGKRTGVSDAQDRYANQEVSYLLQRIEDYPGLVILASNQRNNLDDAFLRRFQSIIAFPLPDAGSRTRLWKGLFSTQTPLEATLNLDEIARRYEIAGGGMINVVRYASLMALQRGSTEIKEKDVLDGLRREFLKEGRTL